MGGLEAKNILMPILDTEMIKKIGNQYRVLSEHKNRNLGTYSTREEAENRLRQIEAFKHGFVSKRKK